MREGVLPLCVLPQMGIHRFVSALKKLYIRVVHIFENSTLSFGSSAHGFATRSIHSSSASFVKNSNWLDAPIFQQTQNPFKLIHSSRM